MEVEVPFKAGAEIEDGSDATSPELEEEDEDAGVALSVVVFRPGSLGLHALWEAGVVTQIEEGGQASRLGIQPGWVFDSIDGEPYEERLLDKRQAGGDEYRVVFREERLREGHEDHCRSCCLCLCLCKGPLYESKLGARRTPRTVCTQSCTLPEECVGLCLCCCGCGAAAGYDPLSTQGGPPPKAECYRHIAAGRSWKCCSNLLAAPLHVHRSSALNALTAHDMVSSEELACLRRHGVLANPLLKERAAFPILNFIVWRRSVLYVLMGVSTLLLLCACYVALDHHRKAEHGLKVLGRPMPGYAEWKASHAAATFPKYMEAAAKVVFEKLFARMAWYFVVKEWIGLGIKILMLVPLLVAAFTWTNWRWSSGLLRAVWLLAFLTPFITCSIPTRLFMEFEGVLVADVETVKNEARAHYNLDGHLSLSLDSAWAICSADPLGKVGSVLDAAVWAGGATHRSIEELCGLTHTINASWFIHSFTSYGDEANKAHGKCRSALEDANLASQAAQGAHVEAVKQLQSAKVLLDSTCRFVSDARAAMSEHGGQMSEQQRDLQNLAQFVVRDGLAGVSEGLHLAVGIVNGLASFKSLWPAALSLGPGILKGTMRAKSIVPEASFPGAFIIILPWIYAPLAWALFNIVVQLLGSWALLGAMLSFVFYPLLISTVGMCFRVSSPQRYDHVGDLLAIFKRIECVAMIFTLLFACAFASFTYLRLEQAKRDHPALQGLLDYMLAETMEVRLFIEERYRNFDLLTWTLRNPGLACRMAMLGFEPVVVFLQKFLLTSIVSTDWMLSRVAYERRFEFLAANRDCLPYHASEAEVEELAEGRRKRLNALAAAFGGCVASTHALELAPRKR